MAFKVLLTGGAGYIGSAIAKALLEREAEVLVLDNLSTGFAEAIPRGAKFVQADLREAIKTEEIVKNYSPNAVMHLAGKLVVHESMDDADGYFANNVQGSLNLLRACSRAQVDKMIFSSSCTVYGRSARALVETDDLAPCCPYGETKVAVEELLERFHAKGNFRFVSLRYFNVAGAVLNKDIGQRTRNSSQLIKAASEAAAGLREQLTVYGSSYPTRDGTCLRDFVHISDIVDAHVLALEHLLKGGSSEYFNCGSGSGTTVNEAVEMMQKVSGKKLNVAFSGNRPGDMACAIADSTKISSMLGWKPKFSDLETICRTSYHWELLMAQKASNQPMREA